MLQLFCDSSKVIKKSISLVKNYHVYVAGMERIYKTHK